MAPATVIVFGPTGNVGSIAAVTAQEAGAKVVLAMRDPKKTIPSLDAAREKSGGYERVQADLTDPASISAAVKKTGATRAFVYLAHGQQDHMLSAFQALRDAGIEFVVFLSSYTVRGDRASVKPEDFISFIHAQAEMQLEKAFGAENYVAVRPGGFATNSLRWNKGIAAGELELFRPDVRSDWITYEDMGKVSGAILVNGPKDGDRFVYLFGPKMLSFEEATGLIGKTLGKDVKIVSVDAEKGTQNFMAAGMPPPLAQYLIKATDQLREKDPVGSDPEWHQEGVRNVKRYTGKESMGFKEWTEANKAMYSP